jgi:DNA polymerase-1
MANEEHMIDAFNSNVDIHNNTAQKIFNLTDDKEVTPIMRRQAKAVNFGIVYGISDFGLSQQLDISPSEAHSFIQTYLNTFSGIQEYMDSIVTYCEEHGYVKTLYNRRRQMPEINEKNFVIKDRAKRAAMNSPIQGTAADLIKMAMIKVNDQLHKMKAKSKMILQVHDELLILVAEDEIEEVTKMVVDSLKNIADLKVALDVSYDIGDTWYEV